MTESGGDNSVYVKNTTSFLEHFTAASNLRNILLNKKYITCDTSTYTDYDNADGFTLNDDITIKTNSNGTDVDVYVENSSGLLECFTTTDSAI